VDKIESTNVFTMGYGLAIFDPVLLNKYIKEKKIRKKNLYKHFTTHKDGDEVISKGILLPMYPLTASNYKIEITSNYLNKISENKTVLLERGIYKLSTSSGKLCIGDISLIEEWDYLDYNNVSEIKNGVVSTAIIKNIQSNIQGVKIYGFYEKKNNIYGYTFDLISNVTDFIPFDFQFEIINRTP
jgi:hypothetical protein